MEYNFENIEDIVVLHVQGNVLTGIYNQEILNDVTEEINNENIRILINLGETKFINSNGLNLLLSILTKCRKAGGEVVLSNIPKELGKLLVITKLNSIFITKDSMQEGIDYLKAVNA